jgi:hypothetical protein
MVGKKQQLKSKKTVKSGSSQSTWLNSYRDERSLAGSDLASLGFTYNEILDMVGKHNGDF